jgi:hypothetical protein
MYLNKPKKPILSTIAAKIILISVVTSTCTSGNQICKGQTGYLIKKSIINNNIIVVLNSRLSKKLFSIIILLSIIPKCAIKILNSTIHIIELKDEKKIKQYIA